MKKILYTIILSFTLVLPIKINAKEGITNYYIDVTVLNNGDVSVKEIFTMNGTFNGMERILKFQGNTNAFDGTINSFKGSDIYNGDSIIINEVKGIPYLDSIKYDDINNIGITFEESNYASVGDYGLYTKELKYDGLNLLIYNPSKRKNAFYIDYTITDMSIIHNDVAELGFNVFTEMNEYINNLEIYVHVPNNKDILKIWGHGPLWGESEILDKNTVKLSIEDLEAYTAVDFRLVFDKSVLSESTKITNVDALDKIIDLETIQADIANQKREEAKKLIEKQNQIAIVFNVIKIVWITGLIIIIYYTYKKHDKEYKKELETKYYRDFPSDNPPTTVGYLIRKNITNDDLSASILMLIYRKVLTFEKIIDKKEDYNLIYNQTDNLSENDKKLLEFLFYSSALQDKSSVSLSMLKYRSRTRYEGFLRKYTTWKNSVTSEAMGKQFYENKSSIKVFSIFYSILGLIIGYYSFAYMYSIKSLALSAVVIISAIASLIYFVAFSKRTKEANLEYIKWIGLKRFMEDFGRMDEKELPEIVLWEKYLVYAVTLGCADKLAKDMEIKAKELQEVNNTGMNSFVFDYYRFNTLTSFNRTINRTIDSSISSAYRARDIANSSSSSGSGSGGGFSGGFSSGGGGGSFGGGGGGGRF